MKRACLLMALVCMMMVSCKPNDGDGRIQGYEYVDLGLSVKWATCNVGATSPEDYGHYFAWGETSPKDEYTDDNCSTYGKLMSEISGDAQYDAATANWGGDWRMPTYDELNELRTNCTWTWTTRNGVKGNNVEGPSGASIFLPAAGDRRGSSLYYAGSGGDYWSFTPFEIYGSHAFSLHFGSDYHDVYGILRYYGQSVRSILE